MTALFKRFTAAIALAFLIAAATSFMPVQTSPQPARAAVASDKYDGNCTPDATQGRCADKCPAPSETGAYNQIGTDPATGAAICHFVYSHACPYTEAVSADDPLCYKNQPQQPTTPVSNPTTPTTPELKQPTVSQCGGK